nr:uncharacterized mitochondrial protein AtMg00810-like [Tanacetum cinerariifolium]
MQHKLFGLTCLNLNVTIATEEAILPGNVDHQGTTRIKTLLEELFQYSQLEILGETISQEDINLKVFESLPTEWKTHTLIWRNKADLEEQSSDDLFNNLKIYEAEVKGLESVEARLVVYQQNKNVFEEDIKLLKLDVKLRDNALAELRKKFEKAKKERDDLKHTLDKFQTLPKYLSKLLESQVCDKTGLGFDSQVFDRQVFNCEEFHSHESDNSVPISLENDRYKTGKGYHDVPPPYTGTFLPPKPNLVFNVAPNASESVTNVLNVESSTNKPSKDMSHTLRSVAPIVKDWISDSEDKTKRQSTTLKKLMKDKFQMSSMRELTFFLGLQVKQKDDGIFISQDKYVAEILRKFGFIDVKSASTPIETEKPLLKDHDGEVMDVHICRSMIGSLMYLTSSRLDIMFAVYACARFQVTPKVLHLHAVKRIF